MNTVLTNALVQLGCNEKHLRFIKANLELGVATLVEITKKARLQRSTTYVLAAELVDMGLIEEDHKTYKKLYVVVEPDVILRKLEAKQRQIGRQSIAFKEALPELRAASQTTSTRPKVRTFEGKTSLPLIWKDIFAEQQEILLWTNQAAEENVFSKETHDQFIQERVNRGIPIRVLAVQNDKGRALLPDDEQSLRQTKLLPEGLAFTSETYIYGNKVAVIDFGKDIFAVVTENEQIAQSQRAIFENTWESLVKR